MFELGTVEVKGGEELLFTANNFSLEESSVYLMLGPNGCGKTSFFKILGKMLFDRGAVRRGEIANISAMSAYDRSIPLQGQSFFELYSGRAPWPESFEQHFGHLKTKSIREMSSGEFQSLVLISHLCSNKKIYLLDEPFSHLNPVWTKVFTEHIAKTSAEAVFIIICHHIENFEGIQLKKLTVTGQKLELS